MYKCTAIIKASQNFIVLYQPANLERVDLPTTEFTALYTNTCWFSAMKGVWMLVTLLRRQCKLWILVSLRDLKAEIISKQVEKCLLGLHWENNNMYHHTTGVLGNNGSQIKSFTFACRQTHLMVNYTIIKNYWYYFVYELL